MKKMLTNIPKLNTTDNKLSGGFSALPAKQMAKIKGGDGTNGGCTNNSQCNAGTNELCTNMIICGDASNTRCDNRGACAFGDHNGPVAQ